MACSVSVGLDVCLVRRRAFREGRHGAVEDEKRALSQGTEGLNHRSK